MSMNLRHYEKQHEIIKNKKSLLTSLPTSVSLVNMDNLHLLHHRMTDQVSYLYIDTTNRRVYKLFMEYWKEYRWIQISQTNISMCRFYGVKDESIGLAIERCPVRHMTKGYFLRYRTRKSFIQLMHDIYVTKKRL